MPAATIAAILMLDSQIEVFGFGAAGPDAHRFPRMILWLLARVLTLRQILGLRAGGLPGLGRVLAIAAVTAAVLSAMPHLSFLVGSAGVGIGVAIMLGERRLLPLGLPLIVAAVVTYGGRHGLGIPLPRAQPNLPHPTGAQALLVDAFFERLNLWVLIAVVVGIIIGAIPGLGSTMAITLLIPVTFGMEPIPAIILFLGINQGAIFGGSIPAVLLNMSGTPSSAATALDGCAMARQGEGACALCVALYASMFGNIFSCLVLMALAEPLACFALHFGPAEMAMLMLFALRVTVFFGATRGLTRSSWCWSAPVLESSGSTPSAARPASPLIRSIRERLPANPGADRSLRHVRGADAGLRPRATGRRGPAAAKLGPALRLTLADAYDAVPVIGHRHLRGHPAGHRIDRSRLHELSFGACTVRRSGRVRQGRARRRCRRRGRQQRRHRWGAGPDAGARNSGRRGHGGRSGAFTLHGLALGPFLFRDQELEVSAIFEALLLCSIPTIILGLLLFRVVGHVTRIKP